MHSGYDWLLARWGFAMSGAARAVFEEWREDEAYLSDSSGGYPAFPQLPEEVRDDFTARLAIYLLDSDLRKITSKSGLSSFVPLETKLQDAMSGSSSKTKVFHINGPFMMQIMDVSDVTKPKRTPNAIIDDGDERVAEDSDDVSRENQQNFSSHSKHNKNPNFLLLKLNDGRKTWKAITYTPCPSIHLETAPGAKIIIAPHHSHPLEIRNHIFFLHPKTIQFLGGSLKSLVQAAEAKHNVKRQFEEVSKHKDANSAGGPPKFEPFPLNYNQSSVNPHLVSPDTKQHHNNNSTPTRVPSQPHNRRHSGPPQSRPRGRQSNSTVSAYRTDSTRFNSSTRRRPGRHSKGRGQ